MRIFFDRCFPIRLARMVRILENEKVLMTHHDEDERFNQSTTDLEWLKVLGGDGPPPWVVVSGDGRILSNRAERKLLDEVGLPFFCLDKNWPEMAIYEWSWRFIKVWPKILEEARKAKKGAIFEQRSGSSMKLERIR